MALIRCSECDKEISDKAKQCPHCGYQFSKIKKSDVRNIKQKKDQSIRIIGFSIIIVIVIIMIVFSIFKSNIVLQENGIYTNEHSKTASTLIIYNFSTTGVLYRTTLFESKKAIGNYSVNGSKINIITNNNTITDDFSCEIVNSKKIVCYCDNKKYGKCLTNEYDYIGKD